jgi:hypothetical protein
MKPAPTDQPLSRRHFCRRLLAWAAWSGCLAGTTGALAASVYSVQQVQAVLMFNFAQFVKWPASAFADGGAPLVIGVLGSNPFNGALEDAVRGESVGGRRLSVKYARRAEDLKGCQMLFISQSEAARIHSILDAFRGSAVLTVSDIPRFCEQGGMINFILESGRVKFAINTRPARSAGLQISSKLLRLAY